MSGLEMKRVDLGELYSLLEMYEKTYGGVAEELLEGIAAAYKRQGGTGTTRNPRGAGRKSITIPEEIGKVKCLREKGYTIRRIAGEMGCSVGRVHKLINEQKGI